MPERRSLTFATLDRVMPDVDVLLQGYTKAGNWSLGQACNHISKVILGSVEGFSFRSPWLVRKTVGPVILRRVLTSGTMPAGSRGPAPLEPKPDLDDRAEAEALRATLHVFAANSGTFGDHPLFGPMSREAWTRLHCIHCAHHLSFLLPEARG